jgi:hypothetical protein
MQAGSPRSFAFTLRTERLGPLPLVNHFIERMGLAALLGVLSFLLPKVTVGFADNHRAGGGFS